MGPTVDPTKKGLLDKLVDLFRSLPPEKAAEQLEQMLDQDAAPAAPKLPRDQEPTTRYKGVNFDAEAKPGEPKPTDPPKPMPRPLYKGVSL